MEMASQCFAPMSFWLIHITSLLYNVQADPCGKIGSEMEIWGCHQPGLKWLFSNGPCEIGGWTQFSCWTCPHYNWLGLCFPSCAGQQQWCCSSPQLGRGMRLFCVFFTPGFQVCVVMSLEVWGSVEHCFTSREKCFTHFLPLLNQSQWPVKLDSNPGTPGCAKKRRLCGRQGPSWARCLFSQLFLVFSFWQRQILFHCKVQLGIFPFIPAKKWEQQALK